MKDQPDAYSTGFDDQEAACRGEEAKACAQTVAHSATAWAPQQFAAEHRPRHTEQGSDGLGGGVGNSCTLIGDDQIATLVHLYLDGTWIAGGIGGIEGVVAKLLSDEFAQVARWHAGPLWQARERAVQGGVLAGKK